MGATFSLLTAALLVAQVHDRAEWLLTPRLGRGQELVYGGTFTEQVTGQGVQFNRTYRLETTALVLDASARGFNVGLLTVLELRALRPEHGNTAPPPRSVRLEVVQVDGQGHVESSDGTTPHVPLEGPPTLEHGIFVDVPRTRLDRDAAWEVNEVGGRPPRSWKVVGPEMVNYTPCVKLVGQQQSEDWDQPRADRTAWRRSDTVWMSTAQGIACRVERIIERREPARKETTQRSVVRYELLSRLTYPGKLFEDRKHEILVERRLADEAAPLLRKPGQYTAQIDALLKRIGDHVNNQPPVEPYRKALLQLKQRLEAAKRGEASVDAIPEEGPAATPVARLGQKAPDFVATDYVHSGSVRLHRLLGRPILLVFYNPASQTAPELLRFAVERQQHGITVVGMAVTDDVAAVRKQAAELRLPFPILAGKGFSKTYGVDATPRLVVLDAGGVVRGAFTGWGIETPREVTEELQHWLPRRP